MKRIWWRLSNRSIRCQPFSSSYYFIRPNSFCFFFTFSPIRFFIRFRNLHKAHIRIFAYVCSVDILFYSIMSLLRLQPTNQKRALENNSVIPLRNQVNVGFVFLFIWFLYFIWIDLIACNEQRANYTLYIIFFCVRFVIVCTYYMKRKRKSKLIEMMQTFM